jgi:hypothetical protein
MILILMFEFQWTAANPLWLCQTIHFQICAGFKKRAGAKLPLNPGLATKPKAGALHPAYGNTIR